MAKIGAGAGCGPKTDNRTSDGVIGFMRLRDEALALLDDARIYLAQHQQTANQPTPAALRLVAACETLRMTARLTQIVAWLTIRRAAQEAGLVGETEAPELRLGARDVCATATPPAMMLSPQLGELLERSAGLYQRAARLDDLLEPRMAGPG